MALKNEGWISKCRNELQKPILCKSAAGSTICINTMSTIIVYIRKMSVLCKQVLKVAIKKLMCKCMRHEEMFLFSYPKTKLEA